MHSNQPPPPQALALAEALLMSCIAGQAEAALHALSELQALPCSSDPHTAAPCGDAQGSGASDGFIPSATFLDAVNIRDSQGGTPLLYAVRRGLASLVARLVGCGADLTGCRFQPSGNGPLHMAALQGELACCKAMLPAFEALEATVDQLNVNQDTPLHFASRAGSIAVVALLLRAGANAGLRNSDGITALMAASAAGSHLAIEMMMRQALAEDSRALVTGSGGSTDAKGAAAVAGGSVVLAMLRAQDLQGNTALHYASRSAQLECVRALLAQGDGCPLIHRNAAGRTALIEARLAAEAAAPGSAAAAAAQQCEQLLERRCEQLLQQNCEELSQTSPKDPALATLSSPAASRKGGKAAAGKGPVVGRPTADEAVAGFAAEAPDEQQQQAEEEDESENGAASSIGDGPSSPERLPLPTQQQAGQDGEWEVARSRKPTHGRASANATDAVATSGPGRSESGQVPRRSPSVKEAPSSPSKVSPRASDSYAAVMARRSQAKAASVAAAIAPATRRPSPGSPALAAAAPPKSSRGPDATAEPLGPDPGCQPTQPTFPSTSPSTDHNTHALSETDDACSLPQQGLQWPQEALEQMDRDCPGVGGVSNLDLAPEHLMGLDLGRLSMSQLDALELLHRAALVRINEARLSIVRDQERSLVTEQARREREVEQLAAQMTRAAAGQQQHP